MYSISAPLFTSKECKRKTKLYTKLSTLQYKVLYGRRPRGGIGILPAAGRPRNLEGSRSTAADRPTGRNSAPFER